MLICLTHHILTLCVNLYLPICEAQLLPSSVRLANSSKYDTIFCDMRSASAAWNSVFTLNLCEDSVHEEHLLLVQFFGTANSGIQDTCLSLSLSFFFWYPQQATFVSVSITITDPWWKLRLAGWSRKNWHKIISQWKAKTGAMKHSPCISQKGTFHVHWD